MDTATVSYQLAELKRYDQAIEFVEFVKSNSITWVEAIEACLLN